MPNGPGKYGDVLDDVQARLNSTNAALIVMDGYLGAGFSVQMTGKHLTQLPMILRSMADGIEKEIQALIKEPG